MLQDIALHFQELFLEAGAVPPLFLLAPGEMMTAEGVDGLSRAGARQLRASESNQLLRSLVDDEARRHGERVTLDVFASGENAVVPRFFARHAEPAAEGVNAFAKPSWAVSRCSACGQRHREFLLFLPPRALFPATVAKQRWRLRRSTHIGGIATDHSATARAPHSTPRPWTSGWRARLGASAKLLRMLFLLCNFCCLFSPQGSLSGYRPVVSILSLLSGGPTPGE